MGVKQTKFSLDQLKKSIGINAKIGKFIPLSGNT